MKTICKKLKPILGRRAHSLWHAYVTAETPQARLETESLIQMIAMQYLSGTVGDEPILLPPPSQDAASGDFLLGTLSYGRKPLYPLYLRRENFIKHIGIFSITGGGKTNVAQLLLLGLLNQNIPFLVVDWKRSYQALRSLPFENTKQIKIYSVGRKAASPFNWNPLRGPPGVHPKTWISAVAEALEKSHISGPGVADILIETLDKKFEEFGFYDKAPDKYPNFFDAAEELERVQFRGRRMLWQDSCLRILRTFTFGPASGAFNARHPIKLEELLEQPVVIELDQELPKPLRVFLSDILLRWIHLYRLGQGESNQLRHVTFLEEVHNLFPKTNIEKQTTNSLENIFREIRSFGEGLVSITQHPSLIPIYILGNCNTQIYLGLQHEEDIITARRALFLEPGDEVFLDKLRVGEGIVKIKGRTNHAWLNSRASRLNQPMKTPTHHFQEVERIEKRVWIKSGVIEELDEKQIRLIHLIHEKIVYYYQKLYRTRPCAQYPLSLSRLMRLCNRSSHAVSTALRYLANTIPVGSHLQPPVYYDRVSATKNKSHRPYRIFLRKKYD